jgi:hypothetical protein
VVVVVVEVVRHGYSAACVLHCRYSHDGAGGGG